VEDETLRLERRLRSLERQRWWLAVAIAIAVGIGLDGRRRAAIAPPPLTDLTVRGSIRVVGSNGEPGVVLTAGDGTGAVEVRGPKDQLARLAVIVDPSLELRATETTALLAAEKSAKLRLSKRVGNTFHLVHLDVDDYATSFEAQGPNRRSMSMRVGGDTSEIELSHYGQRVWQAGENGPSD
jgi:hypothetical protein